MYFQEPTTVTSMPGPTFTHVPSVPRAASQPVQNLQTSSPISVSQEMIANTENLQETKPMVIHGITQSVRPVGPAAANVRILNDVAQARQALAGGTSIGLSSMGGTPMLSNMISSGMASSVSAAQSVISSAQTGVTSMTGSMPLAGAGQVVQSSAPTSFTATTSTMSSTSNLVMSQPMNSLPSSVSVGQTVPGMNQANIPGTQMMQTATSRSQNMMSGMGATGMPSGTGTMVPTPGMTQQGQQGMQPIGVNSNSAANMPLSQQQTSSQLQSAQSKYVKVWEVRL